MNTTTQTAKDEKIKRQIKKEQRLHQKRLMLQDIRSAAYFWLTRDMIS